MRSHSRSKLLNGENTRNIKIFFRFQKRVHSIRNHAALLLPSISGEQKLAGRGGTRESKRRKGEARYEAGM